MRTLVCLASIASIGALVAGCASGPRYYGARPGAVVIGYDGWYDGRYGAIHDGYWRGGYFWYRDAEGHPYRRDDDHHFRRDRADGFQHIHGEGHDPDARGGPN